MDRDFIALDFETTGLQPGDGSEIIEIGAVRFSPITGEVDTFQRFCAPSGPIPKRITRLTGISDLDVAGAEKPWSGWCQMLEWAGDCDHFVAHNAPFEVRFIRELVKREGASLPPLWFFDTLVLARRRIPELPSYKLSDIVAHLGIVSGVQHRAVDDARAASQVFINILSTYKNPESAVKNNAQTLEEIEEMARAKSRKKANTNKRAEEVVYLTDEQFDVLFGEEESQNKYEPRVSPAILVFVGLLVFFILVFFAG